jgi:hypothetical protein
MIRQSRRPWFMVWLPRWISSWLAAGLIVASTAAADVIEGLVTRGVPFQSGAAVVLPKPQMPDGLARDEQQRVLAKAAGKHPLDRFTRQSVVAPFSFEITSVDDASGKRQGQRVDFCFVAYGSLAEIIDQDLFGDLASTGESGQDESAHASARTLTPEELRARKLAPEKTAGREESYVLVDLPILNRVQLRGIGHALREKRAKSMVAGITLDEQFRDDRQFANTWSPISRGAAGKLTVGKPSVYSGLGGYIKVTELDEPAGALFVECHLAFDEPEAWFGGKNLLRSKLPLVLQDNVRTFRRKLANESDAGKE